MSTVQLGNLPYSKNSGRRYNRNKSAFFGSGTSYNCRFTDITKPVELNVSYNSLIHFNAIKIIPESTIFYCFIDKIEYINDKSTRVYYSVDVWETFKNNITINSCMVNRHTQSKSTFTYSAEPMPSGTLKSISEHRLYNFSGFDVSGTDNLKWVVGTLYPMNHTIKNYLYGHNETTIVLIEDPENIKNLAWQKCGTQICGTCHGVNYMVFDNMSDCSEMITALVFGGYESGITSVFALPETIISEIGTTTKSTTFRYKNYNTKEWVKNDVSGVTCLDDTSAPLNISSCTFNLSDVTNTEYEQLKQMPYCYIQVETGDGTTKQYDIRDFYDDYAAFKLKVVIRDNGASCYLLPANYLGNAGAEYDVAYGVQFQFAVSGAFTASNYANYQSARRLEYMSSAINAISSTISSVSSGNAMGLATTAVNTGMDIAKKRYQDAQAYKKSNVQVGNVTCMNEATFDSELSFLTVRLMFMQAEEQQKAENYIKRYGIAINDIMIPNPEFPVDSGEVVYIETHDSNVTGNINQSYVDEINNLFNAGITFI